ncbi:MAG: hypothetical protein ACOCWT_02960 [Desulfohalobiaceae bacterium]
MQDTLDTAQGAHDLRFDAPQRSKPQVGQLELQVAQVMTAQRQVMRQVKRAAAVTLALEMLLALSEDSLPLTLDLCAQRLHLFEQLTDRFHRHTNGVQAGRLPAD